ncbi:DUF4843 domain-containing protein [Butyricimonas paravirosa]
MKYSDKAYVQFTRSMVDSVEFSFTFYPNKDTVEYALSVKLVGDPVDRDREYRVTVIDDYTTATSNHYILPERWILEKNEISSKVNLKLIRTSDLQTTPVRLAVRLEPTDDLALGQTSCCARILWINDMISRPAWWNSVIENSYLGSYSDKKYRLFIQVTGIGELNSDDAINCRYNALLLRKYLKEQEELDNTVYEEDGYTKMTVSVIGG